LTGFSQSQAHLEALPPIASGPERGVYAASSFGSLQANRFTYAIQTLKRPEVRAPGAVPGCAAHDKPGNLAKRVAVE